MLLRKYLMIVVTMLFVASCAKSSQDTSLKHLSEDRSQDNNDLKPVSIADLASGEAEPPTPEEANRKLAQFGHDWFYGGGIGRTALNVGTIVLFPPYALYLVGNVCLQLADQEPIYITDALPETPREGVLRVYDEFTSVPGRLAAGVSGEEFVENKQK